MVDQTHLQSNRFTVGDLECHVIADGRESYDPAFLLANAPAEQLQPEIADELDEQGHLWTPYNCLLVRSGERLALIDTGLGELAAGGSAGKAIESLHTVGIGPDDIDVVIVSHCHPDHIGGLTRSAEAGRSPVFAKAVHYMWQTEWEFWTSEETLAALPEMLRGPALMSLPPLESAGLVETVSAETAVLPGVRLLPAPGHTPGHMVVALDSRDESFFYLADSVVHRLNFQHLDWVTAAEADPELTAATRARLLERAVLERRRVMAFHVPGRGSVTRRDGAYDFQPE